MTVCELTRIMGELDGEPPAEINEQHIYARNCLQRLRKKSRLRIESGPQRLKPDLFSIGYVRAKARTLQQPTFFRSLSSPLQASI